MCCCPKDILHSLTIARLPGRWSPIAVKEHVTLSHGQPLLLNHCVQHFQATSPSYARTCAAVQIAAFPPSPLQYGQQVTACSSLRICSHIPWAALLHSSTTSIQPSDTSSRPQHIHEHGSYGFVVVQMFKFDGNSLVSVRELGYLTHCKALTLPIDADILQMLDLKRVENKTVAYSLTEYVHLYQYRR